VAAGVASAKAPAWPASHGLATPPGVVADATEIEARESRSIRSTRPTRRAPWTTLTTNHPPVQKRISRRRVRRARTRTRGAKTRSLSTRSARPRAGLGRRRRPRRL